MNWLLIIGIIIIIILIIAFIFHLIKLTIKTIGVVVLLALAIFVVLGALTYFDAIDFQENFGESDNLYLLRDGNNILTGIIVNNLDVGKTVFFNATTTTYYKQKLKEENYEEAIGENYKLFIIEMAVLEDAIIDSLEYDGMNISKEFAIIILKSTTPINDLANNIATENNISKETVLQDFENKNITNDAILKSQIFGLYRATQFTDGRGLNGMITNIKNSKIYVYPKKFLFTMIKIIPDSWINKIANGQDGEK